MLRIATIFLFLTLVGCDRVPETMTVRAFDSESTYHEETIHTHDPMGDLARALAIPDFRFIGIMGNALGLPGIDSEDQAYLRNKYGYKIVKGISDVETAESARLWAPATEYATKYNQRLLQVLPSIKEELEQLQSPSPAATQAP